MANLNGVTRWQKYVPNIGENLSLERPFYVEVLVGITKAQLRQVEEAQKSMPPPPEGATEEQLLEADLSHLDKVLSPFVRMGAESLHVGDRHIRTLHELLKLYSEMADGQHAMLELSAAVAWFNSAGGRTQDFYARLSGGSASTPFPRSGSGRSQRAVP